MSRWWDGNYAKRRRITVTNNQASTVLDSGYVVVFSDFNHSSEVSGSQSLASGNDVRVVYWDGSTNTELDRIGDDWNTTTPDIVFRTQADVAADSDSDESYWLYYDYASAGGPPKNGKNIYNLYDFFADGNFTTNPTWTEISGTWTVQGDGIKTVQNFGGSIGTPETTADAKWEFNVNTQDNFGWTLCFMSGTNVAESGNQYAAIWAENESLVFKKYVSGSPTTLFTEASAFTWTAQTVHDVKVTRDSDGEFKFYVDGVLGKTYTDTTYTTGAFFVPRTNADGERVGQFRISDFVNPEPTVVTGLEVTQGLAGIQAPAGGRTLGRVFGLGGSQ